MRVPSIRDWEVLRPSSLSRWLLGSPSSLKVKSLETSKEGGRAQGVVY